ncbi:MAG: hypothetical protein JW829_12930 [Pirellulales bacterium]|nr:hypothetical protein [Pirellulales bacterium]
MKKLGFLLLLLSVSMFSLGCTPAEDTPDTTPAAGSGTGTEDEGGTAGTGGTEDMGGTEGEGTAE